MIANIFPKVKVELEISLIPMMMTTPNMEIIVPIQNTLFGLSFRKIKAPSPTQTGAKLAKSVEIVAFESIIEVFHKAMSQANRTPQIKAILTSYQFVMGFLKYSQTGKIKSVPKSIL